MPYDAALATLEHALILAELHRSRDVKALAQEAVPVFQTLKVGREVLATLTLFREARTCRSDRSRNPHSEAERWAE